MLVWIVFKRDTYFLCFVAFIYKNRKFRKTISLVYSKNKNIFLFRTKPIILTEITFNCLSSITKEK